MTGSPVFTRRHATRTLGLAAVAATATGITGCAHAQHAPPAALPPPVPGSGTLIMLVRHAEKPGAGPAQGVDVNGNLDSHSLTVRGWTRAGALVELFAPAHGPTRTGLARPIAVYAAGGRAGKGRRPRETVTPLAARLNIPLDTTYAEAQETALAAHLATRPGPTLVSWEHGGIPGLVAAFGHAQPVPPTAWPDDRFDLVWTFSPTSTGWAFAQVPQLLLDGDSAQPAP